MKLLRWAPIAFVLAVAVARPGPARGAAVLIPDHVFRLGSCGCPDGPSCSWECGVGKSCAGGGTCDLRATAAFSAALVAGADARPCGTDTGVVLRFGLAGSSSGTPFQFDTAFDLCARDVACTGREPRACNVCTDTTLSPLCSSDDGTGNFPCPPGNVMFFCKDPCADADPSVFHESDLDSLNIWFRETRQPFPGLMRAQLQSQLAGAPTVGRPVFYHEDDVQAPTGTPPVTRMCLRFLFTTQEKPLGSCASDPRILCATAADCPANDTCVSGGPSAVLDAPDPSTVVSNSVCASGSRAGRPCATSTDCGGTSCAALVASASATFCSASFGACNTAADCPAGEDCISCPAPACGDGVFDPGEECDDGNATAGDGCDATCHLESCFSCEGVFGQRSFCSPVTPCESTTTSTCPPTTTTTSTTTSTTQATTTSTTTATSSSTTSTTGVPTTITSTSTTTTSQTTTTATSATTSTTGTTSSTTTSATTSTTTTTGAATTTTTSTMTATSSTTTTTAPPSGQCPLGAGFWKNHPAEWLVGSLALGGQTYTQAELLALLARSVAGDASLSLADQLVAAKLNIASGSDPNVIASTVGDADGLLGGFAGKLPYKVKPSSATGRAMVRDASVLAQYNAGALTATCSTGGTP